jgi:hypothetical protein
LFVLIEAVGPRSKHLSPLRDGKDMTFRLNVK